MRLQAVARGRGIGAKAKFAMIRLVSGAPTSRRREDALVQAGVLRHPVQRAEPGGHARSVGVDGRRASGYAAFVSERNRCEF